MLNTFGPRGLRRTLASTAMIAVTGALFTALAVPPASAAPAQPRAHAAPARTAATANTANTASNSAGWLPPTPANWPTVVSHTSTPVQEITRGVTQYSQTIDTVAGRQHTQLLTVDLSSSNVRVGAVEAGDTVIDPADETVKSMGTRTGAVAGINGGYFDINATGQPTGGSVTGGQILKTPPAGFNAELSVRPNGTMAIGPETFAGTITDGTASEPLTSINIPADAAAGHVTEITPALAASAQTLTTPATLVTGTVTSSSSPGTQTRTLTITGIQTAQTSLPVPAPGTEDLLASGAGATWLTTTVHRGDTLTIGQNLTPAVTDLVTAATQLIKDGQAYTDPTGQPPSGVNPETAVGLSRDGRHAIFVTLDGRLGESVAEGVSPAEVTGYLLAHGAYSAVLLDGGGSTELDARLPGASGLSVLNTPSDGSERPVANGLFVYTTEKQAGPPAKVVINGGAPVQTVPGASIPVPSYASDQNGNPATGTITTSVVPGSLGTWTGGTFTAARAGSGELVASDGHVRVTEKVTVVSSLSTLTVDPAQPDLNNGQTQALTLAGTDRSGATVQVPAQAAAWTVSNPALGSVSAAGVFTAAATGDGLVTVTATAGGKSATASVAVGSVSTVIDDLSSTANWSLTTHGGATGSMGTAASDVPPGDPASGSMQLSYDFPAGAGVKQVVFWPKSGDQITANPSGQDPTAIGLWIKGAGAGPELAESYLDVNGTDTTLYPTTITWQGWQLVVCQLPAGMDFPLTIDFLDLLTISNPAEVKGIIEVADLAALYSPRPVSTPPYVAIPQNPSWLQFKENAGDFSPGGSTILTGDDAHLLASDPGSASANVVAAIAKRLPTLAPQGRPNLVQAMGDMPDDGLLPDLQFAQTELASLGEPDHDAVGNHEITQGANPENGNFSQVFGPTHYAYTDGGADVIVTDSAHGGLLESDADQVPAEPQFPWLVQQLTASRSPVVIVATHEPAYDPHPAANSQFGDRWEAQMYLQLVQEYQRSHPHAHVVMLYGHARGFAEQILNAQGQPAGPGQGIPQLTFADLGMPAYAPADQGGFYHFGLLHTTPRGDLQFTVEPVLSSISLTVPSATLAVSSAETVTATGTNVGGDNNPPVTLPIADPASHVWTSSDPAVASVDAVRGVVTGHRPGVVTISVTSGGIAASAQISVHS